MIIYIYNKPLYKHKENQCDYTQKNLQESGPPWLLYGKTGYDTFTLNTYSTINLSLIYAKKLTPAKVCTDHSYVNYFN